MHKHFYCLLVDYSFFPPPLSLCLSVSLPLSIILLASSSFPKTLPLQTIKNWICALFSFSMAMKRGENALFSLIDCEHISSAFFSGQNFQIFFSVIHLAWYHLTWHQKLNLNNQLAERFWNQKSEIKCRIKWNRRAPHNKMYCKQHSGCALVCRQSSACNRINSVANGFKSA